MSRGQAAASCAPLSAGHRWLWVPFGEGQVQETVCTGALTASDCIFLLSRPRINCQIALSIPRTSISGSVHGRKQNEMKPRAPDPGGTEALRGKRQENTQLQMRCPAPSSHTFLSRRRRFSQHLDGAPGPWPVGGGRFQSLGWPRHRPLPWGRRLTSAKLPGPGGARGAVRRAHCVSPPNGH